jgi:cytochrome c553
MPLPLRVALGSAAALLAVACGTPARAGEAKKAPAPPSSAARFFETRVRPVLANNCFRCHGEKKQKGKLRLDSLAAILGGGEQGPAVVPGRPEKSLLLRAVSHEDPDFKMPPGKKLPREQIADLAAWVKMGVPWPGADPSAAVPARKTEMRVTAKDRAHWSFQPVRRPAVPAVMDRTWVRNPIDAFILAGLEARGLRPNGPASRHELVRRLYYDLTGLPPTPPEVEDFVNDPAPGAYEALVERLLRSPRHGEKWARFWLDLVRFAETNSYERDDPKLNAWRYRDYVIRAFNEDRPFDRFIREQLAGDELPDADADSLIATGYYRLGIWDDEPSDPLQARYDGLDDIVATTGQVFLGLTVDCARCHDHKIDPIPQKDYYRLLAFFHNVNHYRNGGPTDEVRLVTGPSGRRSFEYLKVGPRREKAAGDMALCVTEAGARGPDTFVLIRGNANVRGDRVEPAFPLVLGGGTPKIAQPSPGARSCGRRRALADWIASADNPLTARVIVNRIWQQHFGRGIVRTPSDFGLQGARPTHPELLDWLASDFVRHGWSLRHLHRLIVTSSAYRMSSRAEPKALAADPANDLFWRFDMRRLTGEEIRDSTLAVSGSLNLKMYGPGVYPEIPKDVLAGQSVPGRGWGKSPLAEQDRRSVYVHVKRSLLLPILEAFDLPETDRSSPTRFSTTQPTQALGMLNGDFLNQQAARLAARLRREVGADVGACVRRALYLATARPPSAEEVRRGVQLVQALRAEDGVSEEQALTYYCLVVLNLNEFVYLD